jgi:Helix-turn-helix domain
MSIAGAPSPREAMEPNTLLHEDGVFQMGFTQVPNMVLYARNLSASAKTLYAILLSYSWKADRCFPGYGRLCDHMQLSEKIVRKYMHELFAVNLLRQKRRGLGLTNLYTLLSVRNAALEAERDKSTGLDREGPPVSVQSTPPDPKRDPSPGEEDSSNTQIHEDTDDSNPRSGRAANAYRNEAIGNDAKRLPNGYTDEEDVIARFLEDFSRELGDAEHTKSNVTQALNLWHLCQTEFTNVDLAFYLDVLQAARDLVRKRHITKRNGATTNRMPYYFATIRDYFGIPNGPTRTASHQSPKSDV